MNNWIIRVGCVIYLILINLTACTNAYDVGTYNTTLSQNKHTEHETSPYSFPQVLEFYNVDEYFSYHRTRNLRRDNCVLMPSNPIKNSELQCIRTVEDVYITTYFEVINENASRYNIINQLYEYELSTQMVYIKYLFEDSHEALKINFIGRGYERLEHEKTEYYYMIEKDKNGEPLCYDVAYILYDELICVRMPAMRTIEEMLQHTMVNRLYADNMN